MQSCFCDFCFLAFLFSFFSKCFSTDHRTSVLLPSYHQTQSLTLLVYAKALVLSLQRHAVVSTPRASRDHTHNARSIQVCCRIRRLDAHTARLGLEAPARMSPDGWRVYRREDAEGSERFIPKAHRGKLLRDAGCRACYGCHGYSAHLMAAVRRRAFRCFVAF